MDMKYLFSVNVDTCNDPEEIPLLSSLHMKAYLDYLHAPSQDEVDAPFDAETMDKVKLELYRLADTYGEMPSIKEQIDTLDWSVQEVLVGTVRNQEQLDFCLKENIYYVPGRLVPLEKDGDITYIALHEEGLDGEPCIRYYGRVLALDQAKRHIIPVPMSRDNGNENYLLVRVKEWLKLDKPIPIHDTYKGKPRYTKFFLLQHCNRSYQLFCIRSAEDYHTCATVIHAYNHRCFSPNLHVIGGKLVLRTEGDDFVVMNEHGRLVDRFPVSLYEKHPSSVIFRLSDLMKQ